MILSTFREIGTLVRGCDDQAETFLDQNSSDLSFSRAVDIQNIFYFFQTPSERREIFVTNVKKSRFSHEMYGI